MNKNLILRADSYKYSHFLQFPENITYMHSYLEARGDEPVRFFGLQYYLKEYLTKPITQADIEQAKAIITAHGLMFDEAGWQHILDKHDGYLPIKIRAVKEGTIVEGHNVLMTIESTDSAVPWVVGFVETLLMKVWYPTTVCTLSHNIKKTIMEFLEKTADTNEKLPFMLHDFGYRGASSEESAAIGGLAHLVNFQGTDTIAAIVCGTQYYNEPMAGFSIPASEHSTMTAWGRENEVKAYRNMIEKFGKQPLFACVSDSWNFEKAVTDLWGTKLHDEVVAMNANLVIRPDSGDALENIAFALENLSEKFGYQLNTKGYKVLNNVALIQGDGVCEQKIEQILTMMMEMGYSAENIAFGMGGALLQGNEDSSLNRDTHKFAIKCSAIKIDDELKMVYKDPAGSSFKKSKQGRLDLISEENTFKTIQINDYPIGEYPENSQLTTVFTDGKLIQDWSLDEVRN